VLQSVKPDEAKFKLVRVKAQSVGANKIPYIVTHDGRTLRYPNPEIQVNDTLKLDLATGKILEHIKFDSGITTS
jgi:small subunit ribosomal protein S4e